MLELTKRFCDSLVERGVPGVDLAVVVDGKCLLRYQSGYADLEKKIPVKGDERYYIYSCSKPITCTAALQLLERGLYSLEDRLADYMPEFAHMTVKEGDTVRPAEKPILIRHLFEMTAGFSYALRSPSLLQARQELEDCPTREVMKYLAREPLLFEPGDRWHYSLCHDVLAALVEVISGQRFEDYVQENIFRPAGMERSTFMIPFEKRDTLTPLYRFDEKAIPNGQVNAYVLGQAYASGGAGCVSCVEDYIRFLEALRTDRLLKPETKKLFITDRLTEHQKRTYTSAATYGYGLGVRCPKKDGNRTDYGWGGAAGAYLSVDEKHGMSVFLAMHLLNSPVQGIRAMAFRLARAELFGTEDIEALYREIQPVLGYHLTY